MITQSQVINIKTPWQITIVILSVLMIVSVLVLNAIWLDPLYKQGVNMIHISQQTFEGQFYIIVNNVFSMFCHPSTVGIVLVLQLLIVKNKFRALIHISFFLICIYIIAFMKQMYQQSRPIWSSNLITKLEWWCPTDFGNPSGHSFAVFPLYQPLISKYVGFDNARSTWIFLIFFAFFVPFSRTYLGVHSVNQVCFGLVIGIAFTVLYRYGIRQWFYSTFSKILKKQKLRYLIIIMLCHCLCFFLPFLFYQIYSQTKPMQQSDVNNLNGFCHSSLTSLLIQQSMLVKCTLQSFVFGIMYGLYFLKCTQEDKLYYAGRWQYMSNPAMIAFILTLLAIIVGIAAVFVVIIPHFVRIIFIDYLSNTIGVIAIGFSLIYIVPKIQRKFKWINYHYQQIQQDKSWKY